MCVDAIYTGNAECQHLLRLLLVDPPLSYDEIAAAVGRPRGSLGPTRRRCLTQLRSLLEGTVVTEGDGPR